jgi:hypothetical protein
MPLNQIMQDKWTWRGIDDANAVTSLIEAPVDRGGLRGIALDPQRLRAFTVTFNEDPNGLTHMFKRPRDSTDNLSPYEVSKKKADLRARDDIHNTHREVTINGKKN